MKKNGWLFGCAGLLLFSFLFGKSMIPFLTWQYPVLAFAEEKEEAFWEEDLGEKLWKKMVHYELPVIAYVDNTSGVLSASLDPSYESYRASALAGVALEDQEAIMGGHGTGEELLPEPDTSFIEPEPELPVTSQVRGVEYSKEQLGDYDFLLKTFYRVHQSATVTREQLNADTLLSKDMHLAGGNDKPQILIYHTHASEYFADTIEGDPSTMIVGVGEYLSQLLREKYGLNVIHDSTLYPYNSAYSDAYKHVSQILAENPSIEVVIDLHRDAAGGNHYVTEINGKQTATIMFFNGVSQTVDGPIPGRENPYLLDNLAFSLQLKLKAEAYYPGFTRPNYIKAYRYNMHMMPKTLLIEAGAETNTLEEMKNAMEPLADLLAKVLV